ncbi:odorant receptor 4-like isoform X1 [Cydia pomonella]|uniref:Odorant receptor n=2 Tax=Cydia pomonella TaxID=82600 RepID=H9A5N3_CYDPO|nr:odorant receptor 4-like isoform X1 [Cydia pomonella]AFC91723.2 putative odorant receptor OR22 [Cydia pomonella]
MKFEEADLIKHVNNNVDIKENLKFEYYLLPPKQQIFYQKLAFAMNVFRMGNQTWWGFPPIHKIFICNTWMVLIFSPMCLILQFVYMYKNFDDLNFRTLGTMFSIIPATAVVVAKIFICMIPAYPQIMKELMDKIHLNNFIDDEDLFIKKKLIQVERYTRWITLCLVTFILFDWLLWIFVPLMNNIKNKELIEKRLVRMETCLYLWMPFDYGYDYNTWAITHAMNVYLVGTGCCVFALYDSINFIFIFHFLSHIDVLRYKIKTYFATKLDESQTKRRIVDIIKYHSFILSTFKDIQAAFGLNVAINYAHNLIVDSLLLYQIMIGDKANRLSYVIMMQFHMGGLILMSLALEQIHIKTDDLPLLLYSVPWEKMSVPNQKLLLPILRRMQTPLVFKASGGLRAGVRPLASILKSTFSYYVMLKSSIE